MSPSTLKVAIDARCNPAKAGGVGLAVTSLIHTLGQLDGPEAYSLVVRSEEQVEWLRPHLGSNQTFAIKSEVESRSNLKTRLRKPFTRYARILLGVNGPAGQPAVNVSDGFFESLQCDLIHFPTQEFVICALPSVYNPHDLQHVHYPQFFNASAINKRETVYPVACRLAHTVVVGSQWVKDDVVASYGISPRKVQVIPEHPPTLVADLNGHVQIDKKYQLPKTFAIYPAKTWAHKNHIRLFEALAHLRDKRGLRIQLVCTGTRDNYHWPRIEESLSELRLHDQVTFLGFVDDSELRAIYRLAQFLVMPTLFEASSLPIFEAWFEGTPVASSNATALPDQVLDAALMFDPTKVMSIADAVARIASDAELRDQLRSRGYRRLQDFDSERTAKAYRAVYRRAAGQLLSEEDRWLLSWDWMRNPERKMEVA
jgi:glycosyltransferase involved in cell wall biosynthesis